MTSMSTIAPVVNNHHWFWQLLRGVYLADSSKLELRAYSFQPTRSTSGPTPTVFVVSLQDYECILVYTFFTLQGHPFFQLSLGAGVAYREAVFEPRVCLDVCLTSKRIFGNEKTKKLVLYTMILGNVYDQEEKHRSGFSFFSVQVVLKF